MLLCIVYPCVVFHFLLFGVGGRGGGGGGGRRRGGG